MLNIRTFPGCLPSLYVGCLHTNYFYNCCCLLCLHRIIEENNGKTPLTYNRMQAIVKTLGPPKRPIPAPTMEDMNGTVNNTGPFREINMKTSLFTWL